jgi:hypothetical protein
MKTVIDIKISKDINWNNFEDELKAKGINATVILPDNYPCLKMDDTASVVLQDEESLNKFNQISH